MKEMTLDEIKTCSLGVLDFVDKVCKENHLQYFLCGGTLLGAVRHKGFIPWDDDIDIMMPRKDYEKLFEVWPKGSQYAAMYHKNTHNLPYAYGKAIDTRTIKVEGVRETGYKIGVDVDIFPIDNLPNNDDDAMAYYQKISKMQCRLTLQLSSYGKGLTVMRTIVRNIRLFFLRISEIVGITSVDKVIRRFDKLAQKYNDVDTNYCGITAISHYGIKEKNPRSNYISVDSVTFEGKEYPAPVGYADYLSRLYGINYMQLPPVEMRQTHHTYKAFWK